MSTKSESRSVKSKNSVANSEDSDESEEEGPLPLFNTMFVFSKLLMFMGTTVMVVGGIVFTYFTNTHNNGLFGGILIFLCGLIARYADFRSFPFFFYIFFGLYGSRRTLAIINCVFAFICAVVSFYFWVVSIREYQAVAEYSKCVDNSYFEQDDFFHGSFLSDCQKAHENADCYCVDKHATVCDDYILNSYTTTGTCHSIISIYRYEVAGVVGALTIGTGLLLLYFFLVFYSLCYQSCSKYKRPQCIQRCVDCCFPPPPAAPPSPKVDSKAVERKRNHLVSKMLQEAADSAYNHEKDIELAAESKAMPRRVVWEDEKKDTAPAAPQLEPVLTPRREQRYLEQYVSQKYPHLVTSVKQTEDAGGSGGSVVSPATSAGVGAAESMKVRHDSVVSHLTANSGIESVTAAGVKRKPSQSSVKSTSDTRHSKINSVVPIKEELVQPQQQLQYKQILPPVRAKPASTAAVPTVTHEVDPLDTSSDEDTSTTDRPIVSYSDDEYERPPRHGEGRFDYLDAALDAKVAQRIAAYQQDLMLDPELEDHSFSLQALQPDETIQSHTLDDVKSHDLSTLQEDSWLGGEVGDHINIFNHTQYQHQPRSYSIPQQQQQVERDSLEGQIMVPLQDTFGADTVVRERPPYMAFTHLPPVSQQPPEMQQGGGVLPREKKKFIQNRQYKQQMYLYQHY